MSPTSESPEFPRWIAPNQDARTQRLDKESLTCAIKIVTPMFGGGYVTGEVDRANPIHSAAVRGHLRFWWRATTGAQYGSAVELFKAEEDLWGSDGKPGVISTRVTVDPQRIAQIHEHLMPCAEYQQIQDGRISTFPTALNGFPLYALQPFVGTDNDDVATGLVNFPFTVILTFPPVLRPELESALAAWIAYGGLGARTRRGCGSLSTDMALPPISCSEPHLNAEPLTALSGAQRYLGTPRGAIAAWYDAVTVYREFRQGIGVGRAESHRANANHPGRSNWPEPNSIRNRIRPRGPWAHEVPEGAAFGFPRADLGLPIIFHFKDRGDPEDNITLQGNSPGTQRFASPVITKALSVGNGRFRPLILILNAPHAWENGDITLAGNEVPSNRQSVTRADIEMSADARNRIVPLNGRAVREALGAHALRRGYSS
jgi:CRISPR-associated protein Cmr1